MFRRGNEAAILDARRGCCPYACFILFPWLPSGKKRSLKAFPSFRLEGFRGHPALSHASSRLFRSGRGGSDCAGGSEEPAHVEAATEEAAAAGDAGRAERCEEGGEAGAESWIMWKVSTSILLFMLISCHIHTYIHIDHIHIY